VSERRLYKLDWSRGITDGRVGEGAVRDLVNAEFSTNNSLKIRDMLYADRADNGSTISSINTNSAPVLDIIAVHGIGDYEWSLAVLYGDYTDTSVNPAVSYDPTVRIYQGSPLTEDTNLAVPVAGSTAIEGSMLAFDGKSIYVNLINSSGVPQKSNRIYYAGAGTRFRYPSVLTGGTGMSDGHSDVISASMLIGTTKAPNVHFSVYEGERTKTSLKSQVGNSIDSGYDVDVAVFPISDRRNADGSGPGNIQYSVTMRLGVQYKYLDGSVSPITKSKVLRLSLNNTTTSLYSIANVLVCNKDIDTSIESINVYREILSSDNDESVITELELIYVATIFEASSYVPDNEFTGVDFVDRPFEDMHISDVGNKLYNLQPGMPGLLRVTSQNTFKEYLTVSTDVSRTTSGATAVYDSGWLQYTYGTTNVMMLQYECPTINGGSIDLDMKMTGYWDEHGYQLPDGAHDQALTYKISATSAKMAFDGFSSSSSNVIIRDLRPSLPAFNSTFEIRRPNVRYVITGAMIYKVEPGYYTQEYNTIHGIGGTRYAFGLPRSVSLYVLSATTATASLEHINKDTGSTVQDGTSDISTGDFVNDEFVSVYMDQRAATLLTYKDVTGVDEAEVSDVVCNYIRPISGRDFGLNVVQDGETRNSRLVYSEFRRPGLFSKNNYIDYSPRDDGTGVAIAEFNGRLLIMHSTSVYIVDISAGTDVAWRELGAKHNIGCSNRRMFCETPYGVFFGDGNGVYYWDGSSNIKRISENKNYSIMAWYSNAAQSVNGPRFTWRPDTEQLVIFYIVSSVKALIFDTKHQAWLRHEYDEKYTPSGGSETDVLLDPIFIFSHDDNPYVVDRGWSSAIAMPQYTGVSILNQPVSMTIDSGEIDMGVPEAVKKVKNVYLDLEPYSSGLEVALTVNGITKTVAAVDSGRNEIRDRNSFRANTFSVSVVGAAKTGGGEMWAGTIHEIAVSYKLKRIK